MKKSIIISSLLASILLGAPLALAVNQYSVKIGSDNTNIKQYEFLFDGKTPPNDQITVKNLEPDKEITLLISPVDARTNNLGKLYFKDREEKQSTVGVWTVIQEPEVRLKPLEEKTVNLKIQLPEKITPGIYVGGLSIEDITPSTIVTEKKNFSAQVKTRLIKKIYLQIPGEKFSKFEFGQFAYQSENRNNNFIFQINNQGNTMLAARGKIEINGGAGYKSVIPVDAPGILQMETFNGVFVWQNKPEWGDYTARLDLEVSEYDPINETFVKIGNVNKEISLKLTNYRALLPYAATLIGLIVILLIYFIEKKIYLSKCVPYTVQEGETIMSISEKFLMNWKKLAKINKIKPPYELKAGNSILVRAIKNTSANAPQK